MAELNINSGSVDEGIKYLVEISKRFSNLKMLKI
jgi:hypothetical protein